MKLIALAQQWAFAMAIVMCLAHDASAISTRRSTKSKSIETAATEANVSSSNPPKEALSARQGIDSEVENYNDSTGVETSELIKRTQNVSDTNKPDKISKEESPSNAVTRLHEEEEEDDKGERIAKADLSRESRGNKNHRIYYGDAPPRYPHQTEEGPEFEHSVREGKQKDGGKFYFPKNYYGNKNSSPKKGHKPASSVVGISGKRVPDPVSFDEERHSGHEIPVGIGHSYGLGGHEEHELPPPPHSTPDEAPYHGIEEHGKAHGGVHIHGGYGYHHHYGTYRHTIGDKVDAVGRALQVLIPSALLITGVSALFPNRVHVPTTPNKYRQKRSVFHRRISPRGLLPPPPPVPHFSPEFDDIPSHILQAEHRIMDGNPEAIYPEYGKRQGAPEQDGFDPFKVFKGPGAETSMRRIHDAIPLPEFPRMPEIGVLPHHTPEFPPGEEPPSTYGTVPDLPEPIPPTMIAPDVHTTQMSLGPPVSSMEEMNERARPAAIIRRRKPTTRKPPIFVKETPKPLALSQRSAEVDKSNYLGKNNLNSVAEDFKFNNPVKAEEEFMASLQNLVTPDVAKAIFKSKQEAAPSNNFDLSPDGPVMGLLTSYAQHEKDSPICQKRALCELAVKGKEPKSTKFEAFLWSVATLVPDVFSEMYDLQEVFQAIRDERCARFDCHNPNLDIQVT